MSTASAEFIEAPDVAALLDLPSGEAFLAKRRGLERDHGFPKPMVWSLRPMKWRADRVRAWIQEQGGASASNPAIPDNDPVVVRLMAEARA